MIRVEIKKDGALRNTSVFATIEEARSWVDQQNDKGAFGKPAGWYYESALTPEELATAIEDQELDQNGFPLPDRIYLIPPQYQVTYVDVTQEQKDKEEIEKYLKRMDFGKLIMAKLASKNLKRIIAGETTVEAVVSAEAKLEVVQRLLLNGSTSLALGAIQQISPILTEYPESLKLELIQEIQTYLASE